MPVTRDDLDDMHLPLDMYDEAARHLDANPSAAIEFDSMPMHGAKTYLMLFEDLGRGAACQNGNSVWFDAETMADLESQAREAFAPYRD